MSKLIDTRSFFVGLGVDSVTALNQLESLFGSVYSCDKLVALRDTIRYGCYLQPSDLLHDLVQLVPGECRDADTFFALAELREFREVDTEVALETVLPFYFGVRDRIDDLQTILRGLGPVVPEWVMSAIAVIAYRNRPKTRAEDNNHNALQVRFVDQLAAFFVRLNLTCSQQSAHDVAQAFAAGFAQLYCSFRREGGESKLPKWIVPELD